MVWSGFGGFGGLLLLLRIWGMFGDGGIFVVFVRNLWVLVRIFVFL